MYIHATVKGRWIQHRSAFRDLHHRYSYDCEACVSDCPLAKKWCYTRLFTVDGFHSIFHHRNWRAKWSCDAINKQHGDVMPFCCHSEKMLWNPSIEVDVVITSASHWLQSQVDNCPASCWEIENDSSPINLYLAMLLIGTNWAGVSWAAMWPYWTPLWQNRTSVEYYNISYKWVCSLRLHREVKTQLDRFH